MTSATPETIAAEIVTAREARGMSREELAGAAGVALKTIERIELGKVTPRRSTLRVIRLVLADDGAVAA